MKTTGIKIAAEARKQLETARAKLQAALDAYAEADKRIDAISDKQLAMEYELKTMRKGLDPLDDAAVQKLTLRERQFSLLPAALSKAQSAACEARDQIPKVAKAAAERRIA